MAIYNLYYRFVNMILIYLTNIIVFATFQGAF